MTLAIGIDIGGTGIKGAIVDVEKGELVSERAKVATPAGGEPDAIVAEVVGMIERFGADADGLPVGVCFPAIVQHGRTMSAANVSQKWIGLEAEALFEKALARDIYFVNDADAAGVAESAFGAARGVSGLVLLTTLGTGVGTALIYDGVLIPNSELGHLILGRRDAEIAHLLRRQGARPPLLARLGEATAGVLLDARVPALARPHHRGRRGLEESRRVPAPARTPRPRSCPPSCATTPAFWAPRGSLPVRIAESNPKS